MSELKVQLNSNEQNLAIKTPEIIFLIFIVLTSYATGLTNFLFFHILVEFYSIFIALAIGVIAYNTRQYSQNNYLVFLGIVYLGVAAGDLIHTLAYSGMNVFPDYGVNLPTQLWIGTRYLESISLLISFYFINNKFKPKKVLLIYLSITTAIIIAPFLGLFPDSFLPETGLTNFKIFSEYIISFFFLCSVFILKKYKNNFSPVVYKLLMASFITSIFGELAFTLYTDVYDLFNITGHVFKVFSFYFIYKAVILNTLTRPFNSLFKELKNSYQEIEKKNKETERLNEKLQNEMKRAKKLHEQFLPKKSPDINELSISSYYKPATYLGGDFYNYIELEDKLLFYISDVSGHDLSSSILNIFLKETINSYIIEHQNQNKKLEISELIKFVNHRYLKENFNPEYFICLIIGTIDLKTFKLEFLNAGIHIPPIIIKSEKQLSKLGCGGMPISMLNNPDNNYAICSHILKPGETIFLTTDGFIESKGKSSSQFGKSRFQDILKSKYDLSPDDLMNNFVSDFNNFLGDTKPQDDLTAIAIKRDSIDF